MPTLKKYAVIAIPIVVVIIGYNLLKKYGPTIVVQYLP